MIDQARVHVLAEREPLRGRYVLYWMQRAQRVGGNHALEFAVAEGNRLGLPVVVAFGLMDDYPEANERHYAFMLEGLRDVAAALAARGIGFTLRHGAPDRVAIALAAEAALVVCDMGYLRHERQWRANVAAVCRSPAIAVETDVVVPVERVSSKAELAARTLRPKLMRQLPDWLSPVIAVEPAQPSLAVAPRSDFDAARPEETLRRLRLDRSVAPVPRFRGGEVEARRRLRAFIADRLAAYAEQRSDPGLAAISELSPYLHFGQIAPLDIALAVNEAAGGTPSAQAYLEELLVRRELASNFVRFTDGYDGYDAMPAWARATLAAHAGDKRPAIYDETALADAATHDPYWNAAMREMTATGYMHNHMRMYWGKKILEWTPRPEDAYRTALALNNRFFLDGRDANSFTNVGWIFGLHDRPWPERPVFGTVRSMTASGLERKFDMARYVRRVERMVADLPDGRA